jgi:predicted MFS family arabinose efflux permease
LRSFSQLNASLFQLPSDGLTMAFKLFGQFGHRSPCALIVAAAITACGGVWGMAAAGSVAAFGIAAVLSSTGAGFASPALVSIVQRNVDARHADGAQSVVNAGTGPGLVGAALLAMVVASEWRLAWTVTGFLTAGVAAAVLATDRRPRVQPSTRARTSLTPSSSWWADHRIPIVATTLVGAGSSAVWTYGRSHLVEAGAMSESGTVSAWIALGVGATAVIITAPLVKLSTTAAWMLSCTVMTIALLLLAFASQFGFAALLAYLMFGWGFVAATSSLIAWTSDIDPANAASGTAMLFVALVLGQAAGATALGFIITATSSGTAFFAASVVSAIAVGTAMRDRVGVPQGPTG